MVWKSMQPVSVVSSGTHLPFICIICSTFSFNTSVFVMTFYLSAFFWGGTAIDCWAAYYFSRSSKVV